MHAELGRNGNTWSRITDERKVLILNDSNLPFTGGSKYLPVKNTPAAMLFEFGNEQHAKSREKKLNYTKRATGNMFFCLFVRGILNAAGIKEGNSLGRVGEMSMNRIDMLHKQVG